MPSPLGLKTRKESDTLDNSNNSEDDEMEELGKTQQIKLKEQKYAQSSSEDEESKQIAKKAGKYKADEVFKPFFSKQLVNK